MRSNRNKVTVATRPLVDRRLLGIWKSDRRKTFQHFTPSPQATSESLARLKLIFGKLIIRYGKTRYYSEYNGSSDSTRYEVVAKDSSSVVIREFHNNPIASYPGATRDLLLDLFPPEKLVQIHFEDKWYWIWAWGHGLREYFRRVAK